MISIPMKIIPAFDIFGLFFMFNILSSDCYDLMIIRISTGNVTDFELILDISHYLNKIR